MVIRAEEALGERARRALARRRFMDYCEYVAPWYRAARHHRLVGSYLEQVLLYIETEGREGIGRLMIFEPPRHGKTEEISRLFPSYVLGRLPNSRIILTSYGADLAQDDSKAVRSYVTSERYKNLFGERAAYTEGTDTRIGRAAVELSEDTRAKSNWDLADPHRGGVVAAGIGGGITGKGAHLLIVDDPFKSRKEAESKAYRDMVRSWWQSVAYTRLEKGGAVVLTHTRWHPDDLAGSLLKAMGMNESLGVESLKVEGTPSPPAPLPGRERGDGERVDEWVVVCLPAAAYEEGKYARDEGEQRRKLLEGVWLNIQDPLGREAGEALWPEKYAAAALRSIKANVSLTDMRDWDALYEQLPRALGGNFFQEGWWRVVPQAPEGLLWFRYWDLARTESQLADYTASCAVGMDRAGNVYIRDMVRGQWIWPDARERIMTLSGVEEENVVYGVEATAFQMAAFQELMVDRRMAKRAVLAIQPNQEKVVRALGLQARASLGMVFLVAGAWVAEFIEEAKDFPKGDHDDQVDTATGGLQMIAEWEATMGQEEGTVVYEERVGISAY